MESPHHFFLSVLALIILSTHAFPQQLRQDYYSNICPNVESIVHTAVSEKLNQTFITAPATLRLFFHDCFIRGCDASVMLVSPTGDDERDHPANLLNPHAFDTVVRAKAAVDSDPRCTNKVSCADILAMATRDVVSLTGGPFYAVELGRLDGKISLKADVTNSLPRSDFNLDQLNVLFASQGGLTQIDMIALSGAHTIGISHCDKFRNRIYEFNERFPTDPTMNPDYTLELSQVCPPNANLSVFVQLDPTTPTIFDNVYYKNLQRGLGLLTSDQVLFTDPRSRGIVEMFASNQTAFEEAFVVGMTKLGRVGLRTVFDGEVRRDCLSVN